MAIAQGGFERSEAANPGTDLRRHAFFVWGENERSIPVDRRLPSPTEL
ncbi:hypothetical protein ACVJGD_001750 [Bradyrhizobium sp. USDA 10063]